MVVFCAGSTLVSRSRRLATSLSLSASASRSVLVYPMSYNGLLALLGLDWVCPTMDLVSRLTESALEGISVPLLALGDLCGGEALDIVDLGGLGGSLSLGPSANSLNTVLVKRVFQQHFKQQVEIVLYLY